MSSYILKTYPPKQSSYNACTQDITELDKLFLKKYHRNVKADIVMSTMGDNFAPIVNMVVRCPSGHQTSPATGEYEKDLELLKELINEL